MKLFATLLITISIALLLLPTIIYVVAKVLGLLFHWNVTFKPFLLAGLSLAILWIGLALYGHYYGRFRFETKQLTVQNDKLPEAFNGYKIIHISDLHLDGWAGKEEKLQEIVEIGRAHV